MYLTAGRSAPRHSAAEATKFVANSTPFRRPLASGVPGLAGAPGESGDYATAPTPRHAAGARIVCEMVLIPEDRARRCPYCDRPGPFSNEHIFPDWLCQLRGSKVSFSASFPGKGIRADLEIGDVCRRCNNETLGALDGYAKQVLEPVLELASRGGGVRLRADGDLLLRWVLKVAFNGARAAKSPLVASYAPLVPFIMGEAAKTPFPVELLVALVHQVRATDQERAAGAGTALEIDGDKIGEQVCFGERVSFAPLVSVGPLILQVLAWPADAPRAERRRLVKEWRRHMHFERISGRGGDVYIEPSPLDSRTWVFRVTMDRPGVEVEGDD